MRRSVEILVLFALLVIGASLVLWYVIDRRAKNRSAAPPVAHTPAANGSAAGPVKSGGVGPVPPASPVVAAAPEPVDLTRHEHKTIDFTSGKPVVKDSPEDKAVIDAAVKDMAEATKDVVFEAPKKQPEPPPAPPKS